MTKWTRNCKQWCLRLLMVKRGCTRCKVLVSSTSFPWKRSLELLAVGDAESSIALVNVPLQSFDHNSLFLKLCETSTKAKSKKIKAKLPRELTYLEFDLWQSKHKAKRSNNWSQLRQTSMERCFRLFWALKLASCLHNGRKWSNQKHFFVNPVVSSKYVVSFRP